MFRPMGNNWPPTTLPFQHSFIFKTSLLFAKEYIVWGRNEHTNKYTVKKCVIHPRNTRG